MTGFDDLGTVQLLFWILLGVALLGVLAFGVLAFRFRRQADVLVAENMRLARDLAERRGRESDEPPSLEVWTGEASAPALRPNLSLKELLDLGPAASR